jgi:hypothetical protein
MRILALVIFVFYTFAVALGAEPSNHDTSAWAAKGTLIYGSRQNESDVTVSIHPTVTFIAARGLPIPAVEGRVLLRLDEYRFLLGTEEIQQFIAAIDRFSNLAQAKTKWPTKIEKRLAAIRTLSRTGHTGGKGDLITLSMTADVHGRHSQPVLRFHLSSWIDEYLTESGVFYTGIDFTQDEAQVLRNVLLLMQTALRPREKPRMDAI